MTDDKVSLNRNIKGWYIGLKVDIEALVGIPVPSIGFGWTSAPADGEFGTYNGVSWTWGQGSVSYLDDLLDVNVPTPTDGQVLTWDSYAGEWIAANATAATGVEFSPFLLMGG